MNSIFKKIFIPVITIIIIFPIITFFMYYYSIDTFVKNNAKEKINTVYDKVFTIINDNEKYGNISNINDPETIKKYSTEIRKKLLREIMRNNYETIIYAYNDNFEENFITKSQMEYDNDFVNYIHYLLFNYELNEDEFTNIQYDNKNFLAKLYKVNTNFNLRNKYYVIIQEITDKSFLIKESTKTFVIMQLFSIIVSIIIVYIVSISISRPINKLANQATKFKISDPPTVTNETIKILEVESLRKNLYEMQLKLNEEEKEKNIIFENITHDLRTPLSSIIGYADSINSGINKDVVKASSIIINEGKQLKELIENILIKSKLQNNSYTTKSTTIDLISFIDEQISAIDIKNDNKKISFISTLNTDTAKVNVDKTLFTRVIQNLLSNSIKYNDKKIEIKLSSINDRYKLDISNDIKDFYDIDINKIFDRDYKTKNGNIGIGLNIVKECINKMNLKIKAKKNNNNIVFTIYM